MVILDQIMRLEQRVTCLQNANNVNSCATCRLTLPIHVIIPFIEPNKQNVVKISLVLTQVTQVLKTQMCLGMCRYNFEKSIWHLLWIKIDSLFQFETSGQIISARNPTL